MNGDAMMSIMRTTLSLEPDVDELVRAMMRERGLSFKDAVNTAIRNGLRPQREGEPFRTPSFNLGVAAVPLTKALAIASELEDEEIIRKMSVGK
jgi:hypothetical protein